MMNRYKIIDYLKENFPNAQWIVCNKRNDGALTILAESLNWNGRGHGIGTRYDFGFMQLDIKDGRMIVVI